MVLNAAGACTALIRNHHNTSCYAVPIFLPCLTQSKNPMTRVMHRENSLAIYQMILIFERIRRHCRILQCAYIAALIKLHMHIGERVMHTES